MAVKGRVPSVQTEVLGIPLAESTVADAARYHVIKCVIFDRSISPTKAAEFLCFEVNVMS